jgi:hypothetical protein
MAGTTAARAHGVAVKERAAASIVATSATEIRCDGAARSHFPWRRGASWRPAWRVQATPAAAE